jgi:hypothetical protein
MKTLFGVSVYFSQTSIHIYVIEEIEKLKYVNWARRIRKGKMLILENEIKDIEAEIVNINNSNGQREIRIGELNSKLDNGDCSIAIINSNIDDFLSGWIDYGIRVHSDDPPIQLKFAEEANKIAESYKKQEILTI